MGEHITIYGGAGTCGHCGDPLVVNSCGNAQPDNRYVFGGKRKLQAEYHGDQPLFQVIYNGRMVETFQWEISLCDRCCYDLWHWTRGRKMGPWGDPVGCNQTVGGKHCDGRWLPTEVEVEGSYVTTCNKCGHKARGIAR